VSDAPAEKVTIAYLDDGTPYDALTGEILDPTSPGVQLLMADHPADEAIVQRFEVCDEDGAEWCLEKLGDIEGEIRFLVEKRSRLIANIDAMLALRERRRAWWHLRFGGTLVEFAKRTLGKTKTRRFVHGSVSFRESAGRREVLRPDDAKEFVRRWRPDLVRVVEQPVRLADIDAAIEAAVLATDDEAYRRPDWLLFEGRKTHTKIDTGSAAALAIGAPK